MESVVCATVVFGLNEPNFVEFDFRVASKVFILFIVAECKELV